MRHISTRGFSAVKSIVAIASVSAGLIALSANAQPHPMAPQMAPQTAHQTAAATANADFNHQISDRIETLKVRIDKGREVNKLSKIDATRLDTRLEGISALRIRYDRSHGLNKDEFVALNTKLDKLSTDIHYQP